MRFDFPDLTYSYIDLNIYFTTFALLYDLYLNLLDYLPWLLRLLTLITLITYPDYFDYLYLLMLPSFGIDYYFIFFALFFFLGDWKISRYLPLIIIKYFFLLLFPYSIVQVKLVVYYYSFKILFCVAPLSGYWFSESDSTTQCTLVQSVVH